MDFNKLLPHIIVVIVLVLFGMVLYAPTAFGDKVLKQHDNIQARGLQTEIHEFRGEDDKVPTWTNHLFGGMPTYQLYSPAGNNYVSKTAYNLIRFRAPIDSPHGMTIITLLMLYLSLVLIKVDFRVAALGTITFGLMTSNILYTEAGHSVKMYALAGIAPLFASLIVAYRGKILLGASLFAFFLGWNIGANHIQMTYYAFFGLGFIALGYLFKAFKDKKIKQFLGTSIALLIATILAVACNATTLWTTYEYAQESTRSKSELAKNEEKGSGLTYDYAMGMSLQKKESMMLMVPFIYGGSQMGEDMLISPTRKPKKTASQKALNKLQRNQSEMQKLSTAAQQKGTDVGRLFTGYWGTQNIVGGPIYYGAVLCFLFILGCTLVRGALKWSLVATMGFFIVLSWGKYFGLNDLMFEHFPMYNKFRDVKMTLLVGQSILILLGGLGLTALINFKIEENENRFSAKILRALKLPVSRTGYVLLAVILSSLIPLYALMFSLLGEPASPTDLALMEEMPGYLIDAIFEDRLSIIRKDALISLGFVLGAGAALWGYTKNYYNTWIGLGIVLVLGMADLWRVDSHYYGADSFQTKKKARPIPDTDIDKSLVAERDKLSREDGYYRVIDYRYGLPSQSAMGGYHHKIFGGYHAAKPRRFQELLERYDERNPQLLLTQNIGVLQMFNVKYALMDNNPQNPQAVLPLNPCGHAWFVGETQLVETADEELNALEGFNPLQKVVLNKKDEAKLANVSPGLDSSATIKLTSYHPEKMVYTSKSNKDMVAVFSEMYYPPSKGWKVYIDNNEVEYGFMKANFTIRALVVPAGDHTIEMRFEPRSFIVGERISLFSSLAILIILVGVLGLEMRKVLREEPKEKIV